MNDITNLKCNSNESINRIMLAIDGGGTKTEFLLFDEEGNVLNHILMSASNINSCGKYTALEVLKKGIDSVILKYPGLNAVYMGIAGCGDLKNKKTVRDYFEKNYPDIIFEVESDFYNVVNTCVPAESYVSVICGTGSVVGIKTKDEIHRLGGYGYLFDRTCSGYNFGHSAIYAALRQEDGLGDKTRITELVENYLGCRALDSLNSVYCADREFIAYMGRFVFDAYDEGDVVARKIIEKSINELAQLIDFAVMKFNTEKFVTLSGGVLKRADVLIPYLEKSCNGIEFIVTDMPQIYGAAVYCCRKFSILTDKFELNLKDNYKRIIERN